MTSVWGVNAVAILDSSVNCVCVWSTKKLTMPAYCVAANCNNSQTTPGITMHELPRNRPAVRRKWIKFIQFKRADFLAAPHHAHLCSEHFSECDFANPMEWTHPQPRPFPAVIGRYHKRRPARGLVSRFKAEGPRLDSASAVLFHQKGCGLWTQSCCDFVPHN